jgi:hypothetical protein
LCESCLRAVPIGKAAHIDIAILEFGNERALLLVMPQALRGLTGYSGQERERKSLAASIKTDITDFILMPKKICPRSRELYLRLFLTAFSSLAEMFF